jgi:carbohydrate-selective porin OprB
VFTEVDQHVSGGVQVSGTHWGRGADRFGVGAFGHGITSAHQLYLDAGGVGFLLGDGRLAYGPEQGVESYYRWQLGDFVQIGPDVQVIRNPGYNRDRGTVIVTGARFNLRY